MYSMETSLFSVPAAQTTIFTILDDLGTPRVVILNNKCTDPLTCQYEYSDDGGATWSALGASFELDPAGSGGSELRVDKITQTGRIRLKASGGSTNRELEVAVVRASLANITTFPLIQL